MKTVFAVALFSTLLFPIMEAKNLLKPANKEDSWRLEQVDGGKAELKIDEESAVFKVTSVDSTDWHVQAVQTGLDLKNGKSYVLKFSAKSPERVKIAVNAMIDQEDWHQIGLHEEIYLDKEFKEQSFEFQADGVAAAKNRISVVMGYEKGTVYIKNLTLTEKSDK